MARHTASQICAVPLKTPASAGGMWEGTSHSDLIKLTEGHLKSTGLTPYEFRGSVARDGFDVAAGWLVSGHPNISRGVPGLAVVHSNARRQAMNFYSGTVTADGVPVVVGIIKGWRAVKDVDRRAELARVFGEWADYQLVSVVVTHRLTQEPLTNDRAEAVLMNAGRKKLVPWNRIGLVDAFWRRNGNKTKLGFLAAVWEWVKRSPAHEQMERMYRVTNMTANG